MTKALTGAILAVFALTLAAAAAPSIQVDSDVFDFGSILEGYAIEHTFVLTNVGDEVLVIDRVRATCGCTTTELPANELAPGESIELHAVVGTTGFGGSTISKSIYVYSNDPDYSLDSVGTGGKLTLSITGTVLRMAAYNLSAEDLFYYSILLVDVRTPSEFAAGHLLGAVNIPLAQLEGSLDRLPKSNVSLLYDANGADADSVIENLHTAGYPYSRYLAGGLANWTRAFGSKFLFPVPPSLNFGTPTPALAGFSIEPTNLSSIFYVLLDLRSAEAFEAGHLIGATNVPIDEFTVADLERRIGPIPVDTEIFVYDDGGANGDVVAQALIAAGYVNAKSLLGGFAEWTNTYGNELVWTE